MSTQNQRTGKERRSGSGRGKETAKVGRRTRSLADRRTGGNRQLVSFYVEGQHFAVDVLRVQEIVLPQKMTPIPTARPMHVGLINLRGQIVTALELRELLKYPKPGPDKRQMNLVVRVGEDLVSFLFDSIGDVLNISQVMVEAPPPTFDPTLREYVESIVKLDDHLLIILDVERLAEVGIKPGT